MRAPFRPASLPTLAQLVFIGATAVLVFAAVFVVGRALGVAPGDLTRDITVVAGLHPLAGLLSNLGVLVWCAGSAIALFTALYFRTGPGATTARYLLSGALLSTYLLLDDLFMLHELVAGSSLGLSENAVYLVLGVAVLVHLTLFRRFLLAIGPWPLFIALGLLGCSMFTDMLQEHLLWMGTWRSVLEDGFKWLGIVAWSAQFIHLALRFTRARIGATHDPVLLADPVGAASTPLFPALINDLRASTTWLVPALGVLVLLVVAAELRTIPFGTLSRDVASIGQVMPLTGGLSNWGILFWCTAAVVTAFAGAALRGTADRPAQRFLLSSAAFTTVLMLDDLFLLHEDLAFRYLGIRERYVMLAYGVLLVAYLLGNAPVILRTRYTVLLGALGLFAASVLSDALLSQWKLLPITDTVLLVLVEDGLKWLGIVTWCAYQLWSAGDLLDQAVRTPSA
jgi:hypothetical protein